ncbi:hypothetical protein Ddc_06693 [Ditylenchus destructor]|nr:hypothetical protein Ddc_06693 [Ditylenchus destructor]
MYNDGGGYSPHMRAASMYGRPNWGRTPQRMGSVTPTARRRRLPATPNACSTPQVINIRCTAAYIYYLAAYTIHRNFV